MWNFNFLKTDMNVEEGMITEQEGDQWEGGGGITEY
jgi:hypothetical protein